MTTIPFNVENIYDEAQKAELADKYINLSKIIWKPNIFENMIKTFTIGRRTAPDPAAAGAAPPVPKPELFKLNNIRASIFVELKQYLQQVVKAMIDDTAALNATNYVVPLVAAGAGPDTEYTGTDFKALMNDNLTISTFIDILWFATCQTVDIILSQLRNGDIFGNFIYKLISPGQGPNDYYITNINSLVNVCFVLTIRRSFNPTAVPAITEDNIYYEIYHAFTPGFMYLYNKYNAEVLKVHKDEVGVDHIVWPNDDATTGRITVYPTIFDINYLYHYFEPAVVVTIPNWVIRDHPGITTLLQAPSDILIEILYNLISVDTAVSKSIFELYSAICVCYNVVIDQKISPVLIATNIIQYIEHSKTDVYKTAITNYETIAPKTTLEMEWYIMNYDVKEYPSQIVERFINIKSTPLDISIMMHNCGFTDSQRTIYDKEPTTATNRFLEFRRTIANRIKKCLLLLHNTIIQDKATMFQLCEHNLRAYYNISTNEITKSLSLHSQELLVMSFFDNIMMNMSNFADFITARDAIVPLRKTLELIDTSDPALGYKQQTTYGIADKQINGSRYDVIAWLMIICANDQAQQYAESFECYWNLYMPVNFYNVYIQRETFNIVKRNFIPKTDQTLNPPNSIDITEVVFSTFAHEINKFVDANDRNNFIKPSLFDTYYYTYGYNGLNVNMLIFNVDLLNVVFCIDENILLLCDTINNAVNAIKTTPLTDASGNVDKSFGAWNTAVINYIINSMKLTCDKKTDVPPDRLLKDNGPLKRTPITMEADKETRLEPLLRRITAYEAVPKNKVTELYNNLKNAKYNSVIEHIDALNKTSQFNIFPSKAGVNVHELLNRSAIQVPRTLFGIKKMLAQLTNNLNIILDENRYIYAEDANNQITKLSVDELNQKTLDQLTTMFAEEETQTETVKTVTETVIKKLGDAFRTAPSPKSTDKEKDAEIAKLRKQLEEKTAQYNTLITERNTLKKDNEELQIRNKNYNALLTRHTEAVNNQQLASQFSVPTATTGTNTGAIGFRRVGGDINAYKHMLGGAGGIVSRLFGRTNTAPTTVPFNPATHQAEIITTNKHMTDINQMRKDITNYEEFTQILIELNYELIDGLNNTITVLYELNKDTEQQNVAGGLQLFKRDVLNIYFKSLQCKSQLVTTSELLDILKNNVENYTADNRRTGATKSYLFTEQERLTDNPALKVGGDAVLTTINKVADMFHSSNAAKNGRHTRVRIYNMLKPSETALTRRTRRHK